jgi:hypothetical protein
LKTIGPFSCTPAAGDTDIQFPIQVWALFLQPLAGARGGMGE